MKTGIREGTLQPRGERQQMQRLELTNEEFEALVTAVELTFDEMSSEVSGLFDSAVLRALWQKVHPPDATRHH